MSKGWIIFFVVVIVILVGWLIWRNFKKEKVKEKVFDPKVIKEDVQHADESEKEEDGETIPSLHSQNYKGVANDVFYLSYVTDTGKSEIEEVTEEKYDQFIKDYPSGIAQGNVIKKYL